MFWRRPPEAQLIRLLTFPPSGSTSRTRKALDQLRRLLKANPSLDLNGELMLETNSDSSSKGNALNLALEHPAWVSEPELQVQLIKVLLEHGAAPAWPIERSEKAHYVIALEQGAYEAAEAILERGAELAGEDDGCYGAVMVVAFRAALSVHLLPGSDKNSGICHTLTEIEHLKEGVEGNEGAIDENIEHNSSEPHVDRNSILKGGEDGQLLAELTTPAMLAATWLIESCTKERVAKLQPGGAPSVVHAILAAFAEHVEEEARRKHAAAATLATLPQPQRHIEEERLKKQRSDAVACLLQRLWALLQIALAAGSPAVSADVETFPAPPLRPLCDLDLVWTGVKNFATGWMPQWNRDNHCMYHPIFKSSVKAFMLATSRGLSVRSAEQAGSSSSCVRKVYTLDSALVERIVGFMAKDQKAWIPVI